MTSPRARLARGSFWNVAGLGVQLGSGMVASIFAARLLGPAKFGELGIARTTLTLVMVFAGVNLGAATSRAVAEARNVDPDRAGRIIGLLFNTTLIASGVATALLLALASPIAKFLGASEVAKPVAISAIAIVFVAAGNVQIGALQGFEAFGRAGRLIAIEGMLHGLLLIAGAWRWGVAGAVAGLVAAHAIGFAFKRWALLDACRHLGIVIRHRGVLSELPIVWGLLIPVVLQALIHQSFEWTARMTLARGPNGLAEAGVFAAANAWGAAVLLVPIQVAKPAMPILTNLLASGDDRGFRRLLRDTMFTTSGFAVLAAAPLVLLAPWIMRAYGASFANASNVIRIVALSSIVSAIWWSLRSALLATGNIWKQTFQSLVWGAALMTTFYFTRSHGAIALAGSYVVAYLAAAATQAVWTRHAIADTHRMVPLDETDPMGPALP